MEAAKGCNKDITARTQVICDRCDGKRAEPGTTYSRCPTCKGTGEVFCLLLYFTESGDHFGVRDHFTVMIILRVHLTLNCM